MKLSAAITALAVTLTLTAAAPTPDAGGNPSNPGSFKHYYLKSKIIGNSGPEDLNNLYVYPYHTGAGLADAALSKKPLFPVFINGTYLIFDLNEGGGKFYPNGMELVLLTEYTSFQPVEINAGYGNHGFYKEKGKLQSRFQKEFGGWRVCRWWHSNAPQLFHKYSFAGNSKISSNCADVELVLEPVA